MKNAYKKKTIFFRFYQQYSVKNEKDDAILYFQ